MDTSIDPKEVARIFGKKFCDLTILEFQYLMAALEDTKYQETRSRPETMDLANRMADLTVAQFVTAYIDSLPRGTPREEL